MMLAQLNDNGAVLGTGALHVYARKNTLHPSTLRSMLLTDPQDVYDRLRLVMVETKNYDDQNYTATYTEELVGLKLVRTPTTTIKSDDQLRDRRMQELDDMLDRVVNSRIGYEIDGTEYPMSMSMTSQFRTNTAAEDGENETWKFSNGQYVAVTAAQLAEMKAAMKAFTRACFANHAAHAAALAVATGQQIIDYDISTSWPAVYDVAEPDPIP